MGRVAGRLAVCILTVLGFGANVLAESKFSQIAIGETASVSVKTPEGTSTLHFKRVPTHNPKCSENGSPSLQCPHSNLKLFQGRLSYKNRVALGVRGASASIIGKTLRIHFVGRKAHRAYEQVVNLNNPNKSRLRRIPFATVAGCGVSNEMIMRSRSQGSGEDSVTLPVFSPALELELATDADTPFFDIFGSDTNAEIQSILNTAEAVYLEQLGIKFKLRNQNVFSNGNEPYNSADASTLLGQFQNFSESTRYLGPTDINHLFTGREMDGDVVGLAFVGTVCSMPGAAYSFTQKVNPILQSLIFAHELGHNFGANHDTSGLPSIMSPSVSLGTVIANANASRFSDFSIQEILNSLAVNSSCLSNDASPFALKPTFSKLSLSSKGVLAMSVKNIEPGCSLRILLNDVGGFFQVGNLKVRAKDLKKGVLRLEARNVKLNTAQLPSFQLTLVKDCPGFQTQSSDGERSTVTVRKSSGKIGTIKALATQIFRTLKKIVPPKKKS